MLPLQEFYRGFLGVSSFHMGKLGSRRAPLAPGFDHNSKVCYVRTRSGLSRPSSLRSRGPIGTCVEM